MKILGRWSGIRPRMWFILNQQHVIQARAHQRARSWPCARSWPEKGHIHSLEFIEKYQRIEIRHFLHFSAFHWCKNSPEPVRIYSIYPPHPVSLPPMHPFIHHSSTLSMNTAQWVWDAHAQLVALRHKVSVLNFLWSRQAPLQCRTVSMQCKTSWVQRGGGSYVRLDGVGLGHEACSAQHTD